MTEENPQKTSGLPALSGNEQEQRAHTPGPWSRHGTRSHEVWSPCGSILVADCKPEPRDPEHRAQWEANAKLIAAAPALADACEYLRLMFSETPPEEFALQVMEDPSTLGGALDRAIAALRAAGRLPALSSPDISESPEAKKGPDHP